MGLLLHLVIAVMPLVCGGYEAGTTKLRYSRDLFH